MWGFLPDAIKTEWITGQSSDLPGACSELGGSNQKEEVQALRGKMQQDSVRDDAETWLSCRIIVIRGPSWAGHFSVGTCCVMILGSSTPVWSQCDSVSMFHQHLNDKHRRNPSWACRPAVRLSDLSCEGGRFRAGETLMPPSNNDAPKPACSSCRDQALIIAFCLNKRVGPITLY